MCLAAHDSEFRRWTGEVDLLKCQTFAASPAEPGELLFWFRTYSITLSESAQRRLNDNAERPGGLAIDNELEFHQLHGRQVGGFTP